MNIREYLESNCYLFSTLGRHDLYTKDKLVAEYGILPVLILGQVYLERERQVVIKNILEMKDFIDDFLIEKEFKKYKENFFKLPEEKRIGVHTFYYEKVSLTLVKKFIEHLCIDGLVYSVVNNNSGTYLYLQNQSEIRCLNE